MSSLKVKVGFQELFNLLEANRDKTVSEILDQAVALAAPKGRKTVGFIKDAQGVVLGIFDTWYGRWALIRDNKANIDFGDYGREVSEKGGTASGYNTMTKEGSSKYSAHRSVVNEAEKRREVAISEYLKDTTNETAKQLFVDLDAELKALNDPETVNECPFAEHTFATQEDVRSHLEGGGVAL